MTNETNFHPPGDMLEQFAHGTLSAGLSVAVSAHVELCRTCRERRRELEAAATAAWLQDPEPEATAQLSPDYSRMLESIVTMPQQSQPAGNVVSVSEMHMHERSVTLPRVLARIASEGLVWKKLAGGINQAAVSLDDETQCEFIYMKPGSQVPIHRHQGNEITLVLEGSFRDELGAYRPSDFVLRDRSHHHQPESEAGCLCFAVLDSPLTFTRGMARLLNPVLRYRFRRATAGSA